MRKNAIGGRFGLLATLALAVGLSGSAHAAAPRTPAPGFANGGIAHGSHRAVVAFGSGFAVARLGLGGQRDPSFGRDGIARAAFPGFREYRSTDAYVANDTEVTVGGYVTERCEPSRGRICGTHPALARFTASGELDRSFGRDGRVVLGGRPGTVRGVTGVGRGGAAVAGRTRSGLPFVLELRADGSLNPRFGNRGLLILRSIPGAGRIGSGRVNRLAAVPGGGLLASFSATGPHLRRLGLVRLTSAGGIAPGFGEGGFVTSLPAGIRFDEYGFGFAPLPSGGALVAATTDTYAPRNPAVVRLSADGSPDGSYGTGGVALGPASVDVRFNVDLAPRPDGGAVLGMAGYQGSALTATGAGGKVESGFGSGGLTPPLESWGSHASISILVDGSVVLADANRQLSSLIVARYSASGVPLLTTELSG